MLTVPTAKDRLLDLLRARPALDGVQIEWAHPGKGLKGETIYFGDTAQYVQEATSLGNRSRVERYTLELIVSVSKRGNDAERAERRLWTLLGEVDAVLRAEPTIEDEVRVAQYAAGPVRNFSGPQERVSECVVEIEVQAEV